MIIYQIPEFVWNLARSAGGIASVDEEDQNGRRIGATGLFPSGVTVSVKERSGGSMLAQMRRIKELKGYGIDAVDGAIGRMEECYFDDGTWSVRYLIVNTGSWLTERKVLIAPVSIGGIDDERKRINVQLSRAQIENSPPLSSERPVSRQYEAGYYQYYGWEPYWGTGLLPGLGFPPIPSPAPPEPNPGAPPGSPDDRNVHLRSSAEVTGYYIEAADGEIGHLEDCIIHDQDWKIHYFEVDTRNWWPGKKVLIPSGQVTSISWMDRKVFVSLTRDGIQSAPAYDPSKIISRDDEVALFRYYGGKGKAPGR